MEFRLQKNKDQEVQLNGKAVTDWSWKDEGQVF